MIIILGESGMLGGYLYKYLSTVHINVICINRDEIDATNLTMVRKKLEKILNSGDWVINCMGVTNKRNDISKENMYLVNSIFPHFLDRICFRLGVNLIHPSTDCVFSHGENKVPNAEDDYGFSKSIAEYLPNSLVIRVSIIGEERSGKSNLVEWVKSKNGKTINGYTNHFWNGITCLEYAKLIHKLITEKDIWKGVRSYRSTFKGKSSVSKYDLVKTIIQAFKLDIKVIPTETQLDNNKEMEGILVKTDLYDQILALPKFSLS